MSRYTEITCCIRVTFCSNVVRCYLKLIWFEPSAPFGVSPVITHIHSPI